MKWTIVLIYLLKMSKQSGDLEQKQKLIDNWDVSVDANDYDNVVAADEIVIDFFKKAKKEERIENFSDEVIILPFFSDEVLSFDDIPEDKNWNFVEINSATDLLAMENPHQKKYKTQIYKMKSKEGQKLHKKARKAHNNWHALKDRFPIQVDRVFEPTSRVIPEFKVAEAKSTRKEKRQTDYYPFSEGEETSSNKFIPLANDPWQNVNIIEDKNTQLAFGSYDEYGNKIHPRRYEEKPFEDKLFQHMHKLSEPLFRNKKEIGNNDQIINITINLDDITNVEKLTKMNIKPGRVEGFKLFQQNMNENINKTPTKKPLHTTFQVFNQIKKFDTTDNQIEELKQFQTSKDTNPIDDPPHAVFQVFNPIKVFHPKDADETQRAFEKNLTEKMLSKKIDDLYNKITTLKNFEAFKNSNSNFKTASNQTGVSKLSKPIAVIMKQDKLKLTKPVVLNLFDRTEPTQSIQHPHTIGVQTHRGDGDKLSAEIVKKTAEEIKSVLGNSDTIVVKIEDQISVQNRTLAKLKNQIQGLKLPKPKATRPPKPKGIRPPRPKRERPPKPNGSPRKKFPNPVRPKNTSHKRDLKDPRNVFNKKGKSHRKQGKSNNASRQSRPRNQKLPLANTYRHVLSNQPPWPHHGLPPQVQSHSLAANSQKIGKQT